MLDQYAEEPLDRTEKCPVDHERPMFQIILAGVFQLKPLGQVKVQLDGSELPYTTDRVLDLDVDLRAVKSSLALDALVFDAPLVECRRQLRLSSCPILIRP